jgi:hypothetical protein
VGAAHAASAAELEGQGLAQSVADLRRRIAALEARADAPTASAGQAPTSDPTSDSSAPAPTPAIVSILAPAGADGSFSDEQIAAFRRISDEMQRRRDVEQQRERLQQDLETAGVTLTPQQEEAVLKLQTDYTANARALFRGGFGATDAERQATRAKVTALRTQFESDLRAQVPGAAADQIIQSMARTPGFGGGRAAASGGGASGRRAGMGGG